MDEGPDASNLGEEDGIAVVSSQHLVPPQLPAWAQFEYGLILAWHAFARWMVRCMAAAGEAEAAPTDVLVLHHLRHRGTPKRIADIAFVLDIEDTHVVSYSLKKLVKKGWARSQRKGKETWFEVTEAGMALCERYRTIREQCLIEHLTTGEGENRRLVELARALRKISGDYDAAARAATTNRS